MSDDRSRLKPRGELNLPPRLFRELLDPYKQARVDCFGHVDPVDIAEVLRPVGCIAHFFDNTQKRSITLNLGRVVCFSVLRFHRAAPSLVGDKAAQSFLAGSKTIKPFEGEGAAPCEFTPLLSTARPQLARTDGTEAGEGNTRVFYSVKNSPGTYVIPGQVIPRYQKC